MRRVLIAIAAAAAFGTACGIAMAASRKPVLNMVELPEVPAAVLAEAPPLRPDGPRTATAATTTSVRGKSADEWLSPVNLRVRPGVNQIVVVAVGHPNRIVTPFRKADALTTSEVEHEVSGSVLYVAPKDTSPVTMYITQEGDETSAISLTLAPREVPPQEVRLTFDGTSQSQLVAGSADVARAWEESNSYVDTLRTALRALALEQLPQGYSLRHTESSDLIPVCRPKPGVTIEFRGGQSLTGANFELRVGTVANRSGASVELEETWCATSPSVAAVAFWPYPVLEQGQKTEVYVALRRGAVNDNMPSTASARPALVK
jgi:conjugal transfer pilus assembly protein TraK